MRIKPKVNTVASVLIIEKFLETQVIGTIINTSVQSNFMS